MNLRKSCNGKCCVDEELPFARLTPTKKTKRSPAKNHILASGLLTDTQKEDSQVRSNAGSSFGNHLSCNGIVGEKLQRKNASTNPIKTFSCGIYKLKVLVADSINSVVLKKCTDYLSLSQEEKDYSKTGYTYASSWSYNKNLSESQIDDWYVPNMSRMSLASFKKTRLVKTNEEKFTAGSVSNSAVSQSSFVVPSTPLRTSRPNTRYRDESPFTRSQCRGGTVCQAGCELHTKPKKRQKSTVIPYSGIGIEPVFSEDDTDTEVYQNHRNIIQDSSKDFKKTNGVAGRFSRAKHNDDSGYENENDEDITIVKRITNIFTTKVNNASRNYGTTRNSAAKRRFRFIEFLGLLLFLPLVFYAGYLYFLQERALDDPSHYPILSASNPVPSTNIPAVDVNRIENLNQKIEIMMEQLNRVTRDMEAIKRDKASNLDLEDLKERVNQQDFKLMNCCRNETELQTIVQQHMIFMLQRNGDSELEDSFSTLLKSVIREEIKAQKMHESTEKRMEEKVSAVHDALMQQFSDIQQKFYTLEEHVKRKLTETIGNNNLTLEEVKSLIRQALFVYDADKTGLPDYALESAGGTVVDIRCSETFDPYGTNYRVFGIPLWRTSNSPRAVIQPTTTPGDCWAFKGSKGYIVIRLSQTIIPTSFSYEHIPKEISRDGDIKSAPRDFLVRGLKDETDTEGVLLGNYSYEDNGIPLQNFPVKDPNPKPYNLIELVVMSNHGHEEYTCLYRFRVHGKRVHF